MRNNSKEFKIGENSFSRSNSLAHRIYGLSDSKNKSYSRERSNNDRSMALANNLESTIEKYKIKINVLQTANDKIVNENAVLRLKCKV